jgi:hypothetical protein
MWASSEPRISTAKIGPVDNGEIKHGSPIPQPQILLIHKHVPDPH